MSITESTRMAVARQRAAARGHRVSSNPFSDDEDSATSGSSLTSRSSNPFDDEVVSHSRVPKPGSRERALRPTQDKVSSGTVLGASNNPFDEPEVSKASRGSRSQESSGRVRASSGNPFDDDAGEAGGSGSGPGRPARPKPESRRASAGSAGNPFDDDALVLGEKPKVRSKHNSLSAIETGSGNPFDDEYPVPIKPKHNSLSALERDTLFATEEKASKSQSSSRRNSGGSELSEDSVTTERRSRRGAQIKERVASIYSESVDKVAAVGESVSSKLQKPKKSSRVQEDRRQDRSALLDGGTQARPPPLPTPVRYGEQGFEGQSVEQLRSYAHEKSRETTSAIENCLRVAENTKEVAASTMAQLQDQGEQIRRTHEMAVKVDEELSTGEKLLGSLGGMFSRTWKPKKNHAIHGPTDGPSSDYRRKNYPEQRASLVQGDNAGRLASSQAQEPWEQEKLRQDKDLDKLSNLLTGLKDMSEQMGAEISKQNNSLEGLQTDVIELHNRVEQSNRRGLKLLGR